MSDRNCPDCLIDEHAIGQGVRCVQHELVFLRADNAAMVEKLAEAEKDYVAFEIRQAKRDKWALETQAKLSASEQRVKGLEVQAEKDRKGGAAQMMLYTAEQDMREAAEQALLSSQADLAAMTKERDEAFRREHDALVAVGAYLSERDAALAQVGAMRYEARITFAAELAGKLSAIFTEREEYLKLPRKPPLTESEIELAESCIKALKDLREACFAEAGRVKSSSTPPPFTSPKPGKLEQLCEKAGIDFASLPEVNDEVDQHRLSPSPSQPEPVDLGECQGCGGPITKMGDGIVGCVPCCDQYKRATPEQRAKGTW